MRVLWLLDRFRVLDFELYIGEMFAVILVRFRVIDLD